MPKASDELLRALWAAVERAGAVERELRTTADELAGWRAVTAAAVRALDRESRAAGRKKPRERSHAEGRTMLSIMRNSRAPRRRTRRTNEAAELLASCNLPDPDDLRRNFAHSSSRSAQMTSAGTARPNEQPARVLGAAGDCGTSRAVAAADRCLRECQIASAEKRRAAFVGAGVKILARTRTSDRAASERLYADVLIVSKDRASHPSGSARRARQVAREDRRAAGGRLARAQVPPRARSMRGAAARSARVADEIDRAFTPRHAARNDLVAGGRAGADRRSSRREERHEPETLSRVILSWPTVLNLKDAARSWIQLAKTGAFVSKRYGKFAITKRTCRMFHNFNHVTPKAPTELPIDYDHLSWTRRSPATALLPAG